MNLYKCRSDRNLVQVCNSTQKVRKDNYQLPRCGDIIDAIGTPKFITSLDLKSAYHQLPLNVHSRKKCAFSLPSGVYQPTRAMFGMKNAGKLFQRMIDRILQNSKYKTIYPFQDDLAIVSDTWEEHLEMIDFVLDRISKAGLTLNSSKMQLCKDETRVLGYIISREGVKPDPSKVDDLRNAPKPRTLKQVRQFVGLASWLRRYIRNFATLAAPLIELIKKGYKWSWTKECESAFNEIRERLINPPVMAAPNFSKPFVIRCDASSVGIGAALLQKHDKGYRVIQYASRALSDRERRYSTVERECLAVVWGVEHFRPYIEDEKFTVISDQKSLSWMKHASDPTGKLARWMIRLQRYDFDIVYESGKSNDVADYLSRNPIPISTIVSSSLTTDFERIQKAQEADLVLAIVKGVLEKTKKLGNTKYDQRA